MAQVQDTQRMRIGDLAERSGVPVPTLRAWEQRYGVLRPLRSPGGHRYYTEDDLTRVGLIRELVTQGWTAAAAARRVVHHDARPGRARRRPPPFVPAAT